ncbi:SOS response-associated peptidase [Sediminicoccus sp. BL-A-41-H5]|uniref:SOS response-associated peptidase n=1 Tax=Sediminicoccus sp. BL-A-41-H5 TaxID=3421106 RepID=UPI003D67778D
MCGRYVLQRDPAGLVRYFGASPPVPNHPASWNMAPTQPGLVLRRNPETGTRHLDVLRWGLVPHWSRDATAGARMINARGETLAEKPSFRDAFRKRRCLVPMDAFYEWAQDSAPKQPFAVALRNGAPMVAAGLWEGWKQPDGGWLKTYSVITCASSGRQARLHPRIPAFLGPEDWPAWLGETPAEADALTALLRPIADENLAFWPVAARVGRVMENDAYLLEPAPIEGWPELRDAPPDWERPLEPAAP